ncbi:MAG TPA: tetratricopeptide repeat protein [Ruminiclostridium sp.]|uniref:Photosystem I assembly protein Ycf3 n=1 Tax=Acetivibrio saccincola TaxID=1677857 RepID=A0A2K9EJM8_9FIRM|nr:tetratricopeptide repeat protein [Acetivibrio saccincola]HAA42760.1 tetratricopeptide repeat protein [Ruminiclostridium sp.]AUG58183.1 photosystem I assembly protein Ycf3 [Acetivibrio saccincola]NLW26693.1 tetratricopeptide repeat protein [Acetivibrio saccincola]PQQ68065.1 hypothetical protein B9R14_15665 [Acetivibrio saccincola]HOA96447.1 tetratricopeptide repeat protein [Acetivibrio saccincola]
MDINKELLNYPPLDLDKLLETNKDMPDNIKNSIVLYNKALEDFKAKSEDIAIIQLKKAISLNPEFHEAINLLGLVYIYAGDLENAAGAFKKVINKEKSCIKAIEYLKEIDPDYEIPFKNKDDTKGSRVKKKSKRQDSKIKEKKYISKDKSLDFENLKINDFVKTGAGFLIGAILTLVITLVIYPERESGGGVEKDENVPPQTISEDEIYEEKYHKLSEEYSVLSSQFEQLKKESEYYLNAYRLIEAENFLKEEKYVEAADNLVLIKNFEFNEKDSEKFNKLYQEVVDKAAWIAFKEGRDFLEAKIYKDALEKFHKVELYVDDWEHLHYTFFYMGVCYENLNDTQKALEYYKKAVEKYPGSHGANLSQDRIREIENTF